MPWLQGDGDKIVELPSFPRPVADCVPLPWLRVSDVEADSPAARGGVVAGDLVALLCGMAFREGVPHHAKQLVPCLLAKAGNTATLLLWTPSFGNAPGALKGLVRHGERIPVCFESVTLAQSRSSESPRTSPMA